MAPKRPPPTKAESKVKEDVVDEAPLQAVVLADSYNRRFEVLCQDRPRILLPLCSTPLLTWTLESLSLSKVKQVFLFCGVHAEKIREFVSTSPYRFTLDIQCLSSQTARSAGDSLRELDAMHVLNPEQPFLLVHAPIVSNYDLSKMIEAHQLRREKDKNCIMTMGIGRGGRKHPESPVMLVNSSSSQLLHYSQNPLDPSPSNLSLPTSLILESPDDTDDWEIWSGTTSAGANGQGGYRDLGVDVCEADIPALCTENFDWNDLRRHFVNGVLTSELLDKTISVHVVGTGEDSDPGGDLRSGEGGRYVERVRDTRTYGEIAGDILRRWSFPLVPDLSRPDGVQFELRRGNVYVARDNVVLSRTTQLHGPVLIGPRSALNQGTYLIQSTLGADCSIGPFTSISRSHIFDDVRIGANCVLAECILGSGVRIGDNVQIGRGCLIGDGVTLGKGVELAPFTRIGRQKPLDGEDSEEEADEKKEQVTSLGPESVGFVWPTEEEQPDYDSEDEEEDPYEHPRNKVLLQLGRSLSNISQSSDSASTLSIASSSTASTPLSIASSASLPDLPSLSLDVVPPAFFTEAAASLERAYEEDHSVENALLELRTLVMGYNAGIDRAREEVSRFLMGKIDFKGNAPAVLKSATSIWSRWGEMTTALSSEPTNIALDAQAFCVDNEDARGYFGIVLRALYEVDILGEEDLVEWRSLSTAQGEGTKDEAAKKVWAELYMKGKVYVDVLEDMESDSEEEEEDEDE